MPIRILQVSPYASPHVGGIESVVHALCTHLSKDPRFAVSWCAGAPNDRWDLPGVRCIPMRSSSVIQRFTGIPYPLWGPISLVKLCIAVQRHDIIHLHDHVKFGCSMAFLFALVFRKKRLLTLHGPLAIDSLASSSPFRSASLAVQRTLSSFIVPRCHGITAVSRIAEKSLKQELGRTCTFIPNGVNGDIFHPATETERKDVRRTLGMAPGPVLLFVGRFVRSKGIELIRDIALRRPDWQWDIAGAMNGPDAVDPGTWNLPNVRVRGDISSRDLLASLYRSADVLIAPSRKDIEDLPLVVLEALASGLPPVISQKGGYDRVDPSLLRTVESNKDADSWVRAIADVLTHDREEFMRRAAAWATRMDWRTVVPSYIPEYVKLSLPIALFFLVILGGCTPTTTPEEHTHMHGGTAEAGATFVPGANLSLASLPAASGSTVLDVADGDVIRLDPVMVRNRITGADILQYAYNGQLPGPTIRVRQGATFTVNVVNGIDHPTTIHWHGIRIENRFDGVPGVTQDPIEPGGTFSYTVTVPDAGLFWYHPHVREDLQQDLGLYGNLLVLPKDDPAPTDPPIILALDDILLDDAGNLRPYGSKSEIFSMMGRFGNTHLVNGSENPVLTVPAGTQRLYLTNVANTRTYRLAIDGATMRLVGGDIGFGTPRDIDELILGPAERAIVDVAFPAPGSYALLHRSGASTVTLTTLLAQNDAPAPATPRPAEDIPDTSSFRAAVPDKTLRISFQGTMMHTMTRDPDGIEWEDGMAMHNAQSNHDNTHWRLVDDETGKINMDILWRFKTGDLVKIRIKNDAESMQHPIHFHGQRFLVLTRNDLPVDDRQWKDTTLVRAGETVDLLLETSNPGRWMFHCHIAEHLQNGMMGEFIVE